MILDVQVNAVEQGTRDLGQVLRDLVEGAPAGATRIAEVATGAS